MRKYTGTIISHYEKEYDLQGRVWIEDKKPLTPEREITIYHYSRNGNLISEEHHFGDNKTNGLMTEICYRYYKGKLVYQIETRGEYPLLFPDTTIETRFEYNKRGQLVHKKSSDGKETWYEYDERGNKVYEKNNGKETYWLYQYYKNGQIKKEKEFEPKPE